MPREKTLLSNPLFILSFRQRDELAAMAERSGWEPIAARRAENAERRFIMSGSGIAVIDARGAFDEGLAAARSMADAAEANAAALIVLISRNDVERIGLMLQAGATHYLASPFGEAEFGQALRFAERYTERVGNYLQGAGDTAFEPELHWYLDLESDQVRTSKALNGLVDLENDTVDLSNFLLALGEDGLRSGADAIERLRANEKPTAFAHEMPHGGGRLVHHLTFMSGGIAARVEQPDRDVERKSLNRRDALTGLGDAVIARRWIDDMLTGERSGSFALILVALQSYGMVNASYGATAGDDVLRGMARRIEKLVGPTPGRKRLIARLAGAEFAVGIEAPSSNDEVELLAGQIIDAIGHPFVAGSHTIRLKARAGAIFGEIEDTDPSDVLRRASIALSEARESDLAVCVHDVQRRSAATRANRLEIDLRPALEQDEIEILFQPQVSTSSGKIVGVEALSRWRHPHFGELGAAALFAAADRADYLAELSSHVQNKAILVASRWPEQHSDLRLSVNVSAEDVADKRFVDRFFAMIEASGFARERLTAEVTESGLIADLGVAAERLAELRTGGIRVAIDDFGTGYSSLAYLKSLPLDYLKIDRRLSQDITGGERDRVVVRGVIEMARSLGLSVIAEGVETEEQLALLAEEGCGIYQGFLHSPPLDSAALLEMLGASA